MERGVLVQIPSGFVSMRGPDCHVVAALLLAMTLLGAGHHRASNDVIARRTTARLSDVAIRFPAFFISTLNFATSYKSG